MRVLVVALAPMVAAACLLVARAGAVPSKLVALEWSGPADCEQEARFLSQVGRILGTTRPQAPLSARIAITHEGARWHLALSMTARARTSVRELDAESCTAVTAAAAVIVALTLESDVDEPADAGPLDAPPEVDASSTDEDAGPEGGRRETPPPPPQDLVPDEPETRPAELPFFVRASAMGSLGILPRAAAGAGVGLGFAHGPLRLEASVEGWPSVSRPLAGDPSRGGVFHAWAPAARVCGVRHAASVQLGLCGGWSFTAMHAEAYGVTVPISAGTTWSSVRGDALLVAPLSRVLALRADLSAIVPFARPVFEVEGEGVVFRPSPIAAELGLGAEAHF